MFLSDTLARDYKNITTMLLLGFILYFIIIIGLSLDKYSYFYYLYSPFHLLIISLRLLWKPQIFFPNPIITSHLTSLTFIKGVYRVLYHLSFISHSLTFSWDF